LKFNNNLKEEIDIVEKESLEKLESLIRHIHKNLRMALEKKTDIETKTHISYVIGDIEENCEFVDPVDFKIFGLEANRQQDMIDRAVTVLGAVFSTFKTRKDLIEYITDQQDSSLTSMAEAYMILTDMK
jgi:hypothetical protein